ncbi:MAG: HDIG domain-containing protein [Thermoanaerobacterales bacterium]|nr:HDIG domain-containing protein [Bacillota bacterium]MDI6906883.1 HDIG domain-containing protein [Thermoanaerobacterales bacterium]
MQREEALKLLRENLKNKNLFNHSLAVEAVMRRLAEHFGEDPERWGLAGLLHDIDYERTKDDPDRHSIEGAVMLEEAGLPDDIVYAVKVHNDRHGLPRRSLMDKALFATDPLTGFIVAGALIRPEKKLAPVDVPFLTHRFKEKSFARGANRETMKACADIGLSLEDFIALGLEAMKGIAGEIGL